MRATRLLSILTTLQARGRVTASVLAADCDVSLRTIYRDIDALSAAGIPVYSERGVEGGYRLLDGYRTRLNGLSPPEAQALFMAALPDAAADLGLEAPMKAAQSKLMAALPPSLREDALRLPARFHLDAPGWFSEVEQPPHLRAIAGALLNETLIEIRYQSWKAERHRRVAPLGLVMKGGAWYLAGHVDDSVRTYRVARVLDCVVLDKSFERPADFDLVAYWRESTRRLEVELHPQRATLRVSPMGAKLLEWLSPPYVWMETQLSQQTDADGWRTAIVPVGKSVHRAATDLLRLGPDAEVIEPLELREKMAQLIQEMSEHY